MEQGIVVKSTGSWHTVKISSGSYINCKLKGKHRIMDIKSTNPIVVGDLVAIELTDNEQTGVILKLETRKNYIIRKSINLSKQVHIIASNIDKAFLVVTLRLPETPLEFIDRFLVAAESFRIPVCIIFNKTDLYTPSENIQMNEISSMYQKIGYQTLLTSTTNNSGINTLKEMINNSVCVISGLSGVGKSSLINAIDPMLSVKVGALSDIHKSGKHTTTYAEMLECESGGYIIDTPGIRGFGLIDIKKDEIYHFFPEFFKISDQCQYYNCKHLNEPRCAVVKAVESGQIGLSRYSSYLSMMEENTQEKYRS